MNLILAFILAVTAPATVQTQHTAIPQPCSKYNPCTIPPVVYDCVKGPNGTKVLRCKIKWFTPQTPPNARKTR